MAITTLANTIWILKETAVAPANYGIFNVNFDIAGLATTKAGCYSLEINEKISYKGSGTFGSGSFNTGSTTVIAFAFVDGEDINNSLLITWFEENATQIKKTLTNTEWYFNEVLENIGEGILSGKYEVPVEWNNESYSYIQIATYRLK